MQLSLPSCHRFERAFHAIDRKHDHIRAGLLPGFFERLDRAERHVVVVRINRGHAGMHFQQRLHHFLAAAAPEVAALRRDDLHLRMRLDRFLEALLAIDRRRRAGRALQLDDLRLAARLLREPFAGHLPLGHKIRRDERGVKRLIRHAHAAIDEHHGNFRLLRFAQHRLPARLDDRREDDRIDALRDEAAHRLDLVLLFALRVGEFEVHAALLAFAFDRLRLRRAPRALRADLRETDGEFLAAARAVGRGFLARRKVSATSAAANSAARRARRWEVWVGFMIWERTDAFRAQKRDS